MYTLIERKLTVKEFKMLRKAVGWHLPDDPAIEHGLGNSLYCVCAVEGSEIIAAARVVGDGSITFYIQDVIVVPGRQRSGLGTEIMKAVMDYIGKHAAAGAVVGLMAAKGIEPFYEKFGFWKRPDDRFGCGMMQFWNPELLSGVYS